MERKVDCMNYAGNALHMINSRKFRSLCVSVVNTCPCVVKRPGSAAHVSLQLFHVEATRDLAGDTKASIRSSTAC